MDYPDLTEKKLEHVKAEEIAAVSGSVSLEVNKVYSGAFTGAVTITLPTPADGKENTIVLYCTISDVLPSAITFPASVIANEMIGYFASMGSGYMFRIILRTIDNGTTWYMDTHAYDIS